MRQPENQLPNKGGRTSALLLIMAALCSLGTSPAPSAPAGEGASGIVKAPVGEQVPPQAGKAPKKTLEEVLQIPFSYRRANRSDPFLPFITEQTGPKQFAPEEDAPLAGMQLFEPGQLTLVTILLSGQQSIAMVEDSTGMGHILKVKDKIGRRGEVKAIVPNTVVIEEWSLTTSGTKRVTTNEMVLRKEGEKE